MLAKNWAALGSSARQDRPRSIDLLGFASQLMFTTALLNYSVGARGRHRTPISPTPWRAPIRGTWSSSARSTAACWRPATCRWSTSSAPPRLRSEAIELGAKALMIPSRCPDNHSPSHIGFDPLWAIAAGGRPADRFPRRRRRQAARGRLLQQRPAAGAGLPRRRRQFQVDRLHGDRLSADEGADGADRRPRARPLPQI